jgi:hypothetical protein
LLHVLYCSHTPHLFRLDHVTTANWLFLFFDLVILRFFVESWLMFLQFIRT